jgi:hypothetical protein
MIRPSQPGTYVTIAETWLAMAEQPKLANFAVLGEGLRLFPRDTALFYAMARLYQRIGETSAATALAQMGLNLSKDAEGRVRFQQLLASLPAAPAK